MRYGKITKRVRDRDEMNTTDSVFGVRGGDCAYKVEKINDHLFIYIDEGARIEAPQAPRGWDLGRGFAPSPAD